MGVKPETRRQRRIRRALVEEVGGYWVKIHVSDFQTAGFPDLLGCVCGLFFAFEVKEDGEEAEEVQRKVMRQIKDYGNGCTGVVYSPEDAISLVKTKLRSLGLSAKGRKARPEKGGLRSLHAYGQRQDYDRSAYHREKTRARTGR